MFSTDESNRMAGVDGSGVQHMPSNAQSTGVARTNSGGIQTNDGTLYVSKPSRARLGKKSRAIISFVPRNSTFDPQENSSPNEFRGFFTLFWISMFLLVVQNYIVSYEKSGYPIELAFAAMFSRHAFTLVLSDAALIISTGFCVPFAIALKRGWINFYPLGIIIQHTFQTLVLFVAITWTFNRKWPWVQSGFLTLHSLVMIMKMHSYMSTNGYLQKVHRNFESTMASLRSATSNAGGWDVAIAEARARTPDTSAMMTGNGHTEDGSPSLTPGIDGTSRSYIDGEMALALRDRLFAIPVPKDEKNAASENMNQTDGSTENHGKSTLNPDYAALVHHPDEQIVTLAQALVEMDVELTSPGPDGVRWPYNISFKSFADYMLIPTLVYELEYPRTNKIRPLYVFEKTVATFGTFALLYTITENFILPLVPTKEQSFFRSLLDLALPFMIAYLLLFYIIFECICNGFAELSCFADRQFYEDWVCCLNLNIADITLTSFLLCSMPSHCFCFHFAKLTERDRWNSTSWDEFARKWNKPVHAFLLRHVYASTISSGKLSKGSAMALTFFLSASIHELVMAIVTKKIRMYLFMLQLIQIPLIAIGRIPAIKRNKVLGNVVFWLGLYAGFPVLCVAYCAY
ncbi:hypothetical protein EW145_g3410 [Phellinidium pouzarii]|uniref:O-acyltransferase n=1 Tax=Phellinidium pouzarii TaxID=167371 RepID=A0A4S4LCJ8_9AGAM|nr:hypothetical protein EW145_g3410 [Phellinidium pouzarii]